LLAKALRGIEKSVAPFGHHTFLTFAEEIITNAQKKKLRKLINCKFTKHKSYNLPLSRFKTMEVFIQKRVQKLLAIPTNSKNL